MRPVARPHERPVEKLIGDAVMAALEVSVACTITLTSSRWLLAPELQAHGVGGPQADRACEVVPGTVERPVMDVGYFPSRARRVRSGDARRTRTELRRVATSSTRRGAVAAARSSSGRGRSGQDGAARGSAARAVNCGCSPRPGSNPSPSCRSEPPRAPPPAARPAAADPGVPGRALAAALALEDGEPDALAVGAGTLSLLVEAADGVPCSSCSTMPTGSTVRLSRPSRSPRVA